MSAFSEALASILKRRSMSHKDLAKATNVTSAWISRMSRHIGPSPEWTETISNALAVTEEERRELHEAAARDKGYRV